MAPSAVVFDFNGTLSDDEPILYRIYAELFAELGRPLSEADYYGQLAGQTDEEMQRRWLGRSDPAFVAERVARYRTLVGDGSTVSAEVRAAVRLAARHARVGIVSAAVLEEIEPVVAAAGLADVVEAIVAEDHVANGKPHPEPYLRMAELLAVEPAQTLAFEDTDTGVASARAAGVYVVGVTRTLGPERLAAADELVPAIDVATMERLLACS